MARSRKKRWTDGNEAMCRNVDHCSNRSERGINSLNFKEMIMNKQVTLLCTLAASLLFSFSAQAAETAEIKVKGSVLPPACVPAFVSGDTVDYGTIPLSTLKSGAYAQLETRSIPFTVTCNAKMQIGITATDNRAASRLYTVGALPDMHIFGLGMVGGRKVGGYTLYLGKNMKVDGNAQSTNLFRQIGGASSWTTGVEGNARFDNNAGYIFTLGSGNTPATGQTWTFDIKITTYLNTLENLNVANAFPLDGSATIEVKYL